MYKVRFDLKVVLLVFYFCVCAITVQAEINVKDYGATGDGITDDTAAIQSAFNTAADNETILFPTGTYLIKTSDEEGIDIVGRQNLIVRGEGGATLKRDPSAEMGQRWMTWLDCNNVTIYDITFDSSGNTQSGGIWFYACKNIRIERNNFIDSNYNTNVTDDRYAIAVMPDATYGSSEFVWITDNYIETMQVECAASKVTFSRNYCKNPINSGFVVITASDDLSLSEITCTDNIIINPTDNAFMFGVYPATRSNCNFQDVVIANNIIMAAGATSGSLIYIGDASGTTTTNTFSNFEITNNTISDDIGLKAINIQHVNPLLRFDGFKVSGNIYEASTLTGVNYPFEFSYLRNSEVSSNVLKGNVSNGIKVRSPEKTQIIDNSVEATGTAYELSAALGTSTVSYGENVIRGNRAIGSATDWSIADSNESDMFMGEENRTHTIELNGVSSSVNVTGKTLFKTNNTSLTTIETFAGGYPGQIITIIFGDSNTEIDKTDNIKIKNVLTGGVNDTIRFVYSGSYWYQLSVSVN